MPSTFWWRFFPLFLAIFAPPLGVLVSSVAVLKAPNELRPWCVGSLVLAAVLTDYLAYRIWP